MRHDVNTEGLENRHLGSLALFGFSSPDLMEDRVPNLVLAQLFEAPFVRQEPPEVDLRVIKSETDDVNLTTRAAPSVARSRARRSAAPRSYPVC